MTHDWIIDVLTDLKTFARANAMNALAEQLDEAQLIAQLEIASGAEGGAFGICGELPRNGRVTGAA
ncbi:hypothetical protein KO516_14835 [Citreicella sp. C3M06]|uniref:hypothetical protein n=1 Tax=Citreicella sp. C3M06 TaxID=2841564 RepID=UPI001C097733|nr:hypothetical protein [Citreicella sp. C3M06]MBU2962064.1 hypothetical protein [Citreicella sp. C3M06]